MVTIGDEEEIEGDSQEKVYNPKMSWHAHEIATGKELLVTRKMVVDPALPYIFIPQSDYKKFLQ